jgi:hypothetical protein
MARAQFQEFHICEIETVSKQFMYFELDKDNTAKKKTKTLVGFSKYTNDRLYNKTTDKVGNTNHHRLATSRT